jgi:hypothetical protein
MLLLRRQRPRLWTPRAGRLGITATVSFPFIVNNVEMPAGDYVVRDESEGSGVLEIQSADGRHTAIVNTIPVNSSDNADQPKLVFSELQGHHFLARVTDENGTTREIQLSPETMQQEIAQAEAAK